MTNLIALLPLLFGGVALLELLVYFGWPAGLSRLAFIPIAERHVKLKPPAEVTAVTQGSYRAPGLRKLTLADIKIAPLRQSSGTVIGRRGSDVWMRLRYRFIGWNRALGVARITTHLDGNTVTLQARLLPVPVSSILMVLAWIAFAVIYSTAGVVMLSTLMIGGLGISLTLWMSYSRMRAAAERLLDHMSHNVRYTKTPSGIQAEDSDALPLLAR